MNYKKIPLLVWVVLLGGASGLLLGLIFSGSDEVTDKAHLEDQNSKPLLEEIIIETTSKPIPPETIEVVEEDVTIDELVDQVVSEDLATLVPETVQDKSGDIALEKSDKSLTIKEKIWIKNSLSYVSKDGDTKPIIAIIIDDVGVAQAHSRKATALPAPMTMAFLPYGDNLEKHISDAQQNGHEIMLHLPMEPKNPSVNPGQNALMMHMDAIEVVDKLIWNLDRFDGYFAVNNHMGSKFTAHKELMRLVMAEIKRRDLAFIDSLTAQNSQGYRLAKEMNVPYAVRDIFLDHVNEEEAIQKQLELVEARARKQGHAIAIGHPYPATVKVLTDWAKDIEVRGFKLVPASVIVKRKWQAQGNSLETVVQSH